MATVPHAQPPSKPGLLTPGRVSNLTKAVTHRTLGRAWKQVWSYGTPQACVEACETIKSDLSSTMDDTDIADASVTPERPPFVNGDILRGVDDKLWTRCLATFSPGKAYDVIGWSQSIFAQLASHACSRKCLRHLVESMLVDTLPPYVCSLLTVSRLASLYKNATAGIRPISIPTVFRKAAGCITNLLYRDAMTEEVGTFQYGCGRSQGLSLLAGAVSQVCEDRPDWCHGHLDMHNAFSLLKRDKVPSALRQVSQQLVDSQRHWLIEQPHVAIGLAPSP